MTHAPYLDLPEPGPGAQAVHASVPAFVAAHLREAILSGAIAPEALLRQEDIAGRLGVSRPPVREALRQLEAEGLAQSRPRRGYVVAALDPADIAEIFEIRALFEERIGQAAARLRTEADLAALEVEVAAMEALPAGTPEGGRSFGEHNRRFHDRIHAASGRRVMGELLGVLGNRVERYIRLGGQIANSRGQVNREHRDILAALREGDGDRLGLLLRLHVHDAGARLLRSLRAR
ncbi:GntR family transcriptional regulator [Roseomonas sp. HJA6]|uniref:GntR family transcriptional regulator n=1 Tax=Roseomonas alba TaxID=2846776 RepID=A0ABS7A4R4_9PROT|nr:GntR family transcriptional regulator [Neoroseomonas alba]MBW6397255.1 GntR family transcriptional regulator [Neoroseomonas alba]